MSLRLTPYVVLDGETKEAIAFYEKALDAKVVFVQTFADMPANPDFPLPDEAKGRVAHASLKVGDSDLMFSDSFPGQSIPKGDHVTICIVSDDVEKSKRIFDALQDGGQVLMPLQETHFSPAYGNLKDKFGITFQIFTEGNQ
ncbi:VOC family protein [Brevibacillus reuszeri]|uniref:3-demethylubiquinone-9 3-methyltransferase n=1 Tax=Brevibacillus reuszeri TaxID=54915 RepID=A0A0K9Z0W5_9BACL|nr:VOC family protein [Brevibacillus reuszeri]KNB74609.1 3-demethylubiquinone-9 3-methyltransferase [Brevibacillus reuszeri]MED1856547.1 VOC family protein [Brevibacillus reuszeri]GED67754.1 VOC family protein [Brevibacillus reuszeri]